MTLKVFIEVWPFGSEKEAYDLHELSISNIGQIEGDLCEYVFSLDKETAPDTILHSRKEGACELLRKICSTNFVYDRTKFFGRKSDDEGAVS